MSIPCRTVIVTVIVALLAALAFTIPVIAADDAGDSRTDLPVTRAVLFASGVGYFEHDGTVTGDANLSLAFRIAQINDVLKSLVAFDRDGGTIAGVTYAPADPLDRALDSFSIDVRPDTLHAFLQHARGAEVSIDTPQTVTGRILSVDWRAPIVDNPDADLRDYHVHLLTAEGIRSIPLRAAQAIRFTDPRLAADLEKALTVIAAARDADARPVTLHFAGQGQRRVRVGYLVESPVWKTSYRLDLSGDKPVLQGWAIVENTSDVDWRDVTLSLVAGRPISFVQDLYTPLYADRPVVQPPSYAHLTPRRHEEGIAAQRDEQEFAFARGMTVRKQEARPMPAPAAEAMSDAVVGRAAAMPEVRLDADALTAAATQRVGQLFQFTLPQPVDVPRRSSAMLPLVSTAVTAEKLSLYNQQALAAHPLHAVFLSNSTDLSLLAGPVTVFDGGAYGGDAQLDDMPAGDRRLLSYAVDLDVTVDPSQAASSQIAAARIVRGVLQLTHATEHQQTYALRNKADKPRTLLLEQPIVQGAELMEPAKPEEKTPTLYRFRLDLPAGQTRDFAVTQRTTHLEHIALLDRPINALLGYARNDRIPAKQREAIEQAARMRQALADLEQQLGQQHEQRDVIHREQQRLRENLAAVDAGSSLHRRYLDTLGKQEDQLETIDRRTAELQQQINQQRQKLVEYLNNLNMQ